MDQKNLIDVPSCLNCKGRKDSQLFCDLAHDDLENLSVDRADNFYKKGQDIFYEGNKGHGLYCIYKGKVKIHKLGNHAKDQILRLAKEGDVLGYRSLLSNEPYNASATALTDCIICYIPKSNFHEVLASSSNLTAKTFQLLTQDLKKSEDSLINITHKYVVARIAESLLVLKAKFGMMADKKTIDVVLSRREIGEIAGATTETTIRTLSDFKKKGIVNLKGKRIEIVDLAQLIHVANIAD
jgi:CRP-like cAMP-binding protein